MLRVHLVAIDVFRAVRVAKRFFFHVNFLVLSRHLVLLKKSFRLFEIFFLGLTHLTSLLCFGVLVGQVSLDELIDIVFRSAKRL